MSLRTRIEVYALFVDDLPALQHWSQWLGSLPAPASEQALTFLVKTSTERCLAQWLKILRPLQDPADLRLRVVQRVVELQPATLKLLARLLDVTGTSVQRILDLGASAIALLPRLLDELPMATLMTVLHRLHSDRLMLAVIRALDELPDSNTVVRLVDALAIVDSTRALDLFLPAVLDYSRRDELLRLFLNFSPQQQLRFLDLMVATMDAAATVEPTTPRDDRFVLFHLFLCAHFRSYDLVIHRLSALPPPTVGAMVLTLAKYSEDDLVLVGDVIESVAGPPTLAMVLKLFDSFPHDARVLLVSEWVHDMPGDDAMVVYEALSRLQTDATGPTKLVKVLEMLVSLRKADKRRLCQRVLQLPTTKKATKAGGDDDASQQAPLNDLILSYLCECALAERDVIKLFASIDRSQFSDLLYLLRTQQRAPEQVALTTLLLGLSRAANARVLTLLRSMEVDTLDAFFQLLLIMPTSEYKMVTKLLVSTDISASQFAQIVLVTMSLMSQAASREMIGFIATLPPAQRQCFLSLITDKPQNGVLTRLVATSNRLPPDMLSALLELFVALAWDARSALLEQIRSFEDVEVVGVYLHILQSIASFALSDTAPTPPLLPRVVHIITLLQLSTRASLVDLLGHVAPLERCLILRRLDAKPKDGLASFCRKATDSSIAEPVRVLFWRVFARLEPRFDDGMLVVLQQRQCWVFFKYLGDVLVNCQESSAETSIVNGFVASLLLLQHADDFALLRDVMEEALESKAIQLQELVIVLAHFRDRDRVLLFLRYVARLTRRSPSMLFFRVLAKYQETAFLFDMCNILDLDDALFALRRLERMWGHDRERTDAALHAMAAKGAAQAKEAFCHFVLGFKERDPSNRLQRAPVPERTLGRSESAPSTLHSLSSPPPITTTNPSKAHRGLRAALDDPIEEFHVPRDRGASIFQKQCEYEVEHGPSRLRVAKTKGAQARIFAARVQRAMGQRPHQTSPMKPSLQRGDPHTIERATAAIATAAVSRSSPVLRWSRLEAEQIPGR
ncbi:hypothetical protein ATCC90586_000551 [Pythium insidiosum]|nr:hypothetical protein ATCC90586_000551 [Pythium insidiosum]